VTTTVRISDETHERLVALANTSGRRMQALLEEAVVAYEANAFWESFQAGYDRLADDADQWIEVEAERTGEASALADDLDRA
jgi:predicted transcriptional regulator